MTIERIDEVRVKYLYICDNVATKYNLDEDGKQDLVLYYLELCQNKPDLVRKGSYRLYGYLYSRAERILRRREREAVRECSIEECELYDDSISQVEDKVWGESLSEEIEQLLPTLAAREVEVLRAVTMGGETLVECGRALGLTKERIRQIEAKALRKLRHPSRSKYLKPFLVTTVPKNRVRNEKPSYKFVYDTPWLRPVPCEHAHGKNFEVKIYESDGYVIWVEGQRNGGYVNGKEFRLCSREQATHYRSVADARRAAVLLATDAVLIDSRILIPERITAEYSWRSTLLSVCKVHGADTYVVQRRMWNIVHYLRDDGEVAENLQSANFFPSEEAAQSVIDSLCAEEFREKVATSLGAGVQGVCKVLKYVIQDVENNLYYAGDDQWVAAINKAKRFEDKTSAAVVGARLLPIGRTTAEPVLS